jgi:hypothetical protein
MKLSTFLLRAAVITSFSLLYVWQQTEIVRLAYACQKNLTVFQDSLDKNSVLRYNLKRNTSLTRIGNRLMESNEFHLPESYCLLKLASSREGEASRHPSAIKKESFVSRFLGVKTEAEAKTINNR